ncbi:MAG TPA: peptide deformylase [Candidatus Dormibacteraeota bacterium]|jgi:peptide deformylase|nr:peptide deformylase [Candidatus Dormibacteraeota bacterium]
MDAAHPDLVLIGDPVLRRRAQPVIDFTQAQELVDRLADILAEIHGAGLAAPQIGVSLQALVVEVRQNEDFPDRPVSPLMAMVNPRITAASEESDRDWEGCFSVPGLIGVVPRATWIEVDYQDPDGTGREQRYEGYVARVLQHEIDHLHGIFFLDRMPNLLSLSTLENRRREVERREQAEAAG